MMLQKDVPQVPTASLHLAFPESEKEQEVAEKQSSCVCKKNQMWGEKSHFWREKKILLSAKSGVESD